MASLVLGDNDVVGEVAEILGTNRLPNEIIAAPEKLNPSGEGDDSLAVRLSGPLKVTIQAMRPS